MLLYCTSVCKRPQSSPQFCSASVIFSLYKVYSTSLLNICAVKCALNTDLVKSTVPLFDYIFSTVHILFQTLPEKRKEKFSESKENWTASTHNWEKVFREQAFREQTGQGTAVKGLSVQENQGETQSSKNCFFIVYGFVTLDWEHCIVRMRTIAELWIKSSRVVDEI
jgi:hypothetical protein